MPVYAIIPARGGSKGIPGKNLRSLGGVPLLARTIRAAFASNRVDRVVVTTDDDAIAEVAEREGAEVVERPPTIAGDGASSESALLHALDELAARGAATPDIVVMLQCTSPLTTAREIDGTIEAMERDNADTAFTGVRSHAFLWRPGDAGATPVNHTADHRPRRQDLQPEYADTGAVYAMRHDGLRASGSRFFGRVAIFEVPAEHGLEVDTELDLAALDAIAAVLETHGRSDVLPEPVDGIAFDFDGVLTDNRVVTAADGSESVRSSRGDGLGIEMLRKAGVPMVVLSKEQNRVVAARCRKLQLPCIQGLDDKTAAFTNWMKENELEPARVLFVGNDVNDVPCLELAGCAVVVGDAVPEAIAVADLVLTRPGGAGAVRELADLVLAKQKGQA